jgi:hypothetical protein
MTPRIKKLFRSTHGEEAGEGWDGVEAWLLRSGWSRARRVVVLRRARTGERSIAGEEDNQDPFAFIEGDVPTARDEYAGQTRLPRTPRRLRRRSYKPY